MYHFRGHQGFLAYGCYGYTVVIDPVTLQVVQTLGPHSGYVTHVSKINDNKLFSYCSWLIISIERDILSTKKQIVIFSLSFRRNSWAIVITRSSLSAASCKNFNVAHYSKSIKDISTKLGIVAHHDNVQFQGKGHNCESYIFAVMPLFN